MTGQADTPRKKRWAVVLEDKNSGIKLGKWFWTRWRAAAHLHRVANNPEVSFYFMTRLVKRSGR